MDNSEPLRVGIVGCGYQGGRLAQAIALVDTLAVTACADIIPERAVELAASAGGASAHASAEELLEKSDVDVVMVATPHHVLAPISLLAIQAGKHVLGEKPCGMNARELAEIQESAARAGVTFLAGYSFRYIPAWYKIHELLEQGVVGEIQSVMGSIGGGPMSEGWKSTLETGGGPLMFLGSHIVDQVLWYVQDEPVEVYADMRLRSDTGADETTAFQVRFARGATAQLMTTQTAPALISWLNIYGRNGSICMQISGFLDYELKVSSAVVEEYKQPATFHVPFTGDVRNVKHSRQLNEFVTAIRTGQPPFVTAEDGRKVMEVLDAVFASARSNQPVALPKPVTA